MTATTASHTVLASTNAPGVPTVVTAGGAALNVRGLSKSFGGVRAIEGVDLEVAPGEIRAIIGPNGAGKSTLINLMSGLYDADAGEIRVGDGAPITRAHQLARRGVARTFQNLALFDGLTVAQNVAIGLQPMRQATTVEQFLGTRRARRERTAIRSRVTEALAFVDLVSIADRAIGGLPYGTRKRVELARALVVAPRLLLLDEPLAGMDGDEKAAMADRIRTIRSNYATTIVLIEHDIGIVMSLADRIAVLDFGRKIADGTPDVVRRDPAVIAAYLGVDPDLDLAA